MVSFATDSDYVAHTGLTFDDAASVALDAACDVVRDYICQQIDVVTNDVVTLYGTGTRALTLPELPVTAVTSVTLDGTAVTDWTIDQYGLLWRDNPAWWDRASKYVVTYSHGYATVPALLVRVACQLAAMSPTPGMKSIGPFVMADDPADAVLSALDRRIVKRIPVP